MQVLGQNSNGAHNHLANIKVFGSLNDAVDYYVDFPDEHLVQRLLRTRLGDAVPRQDQLSVGALKHWGEQPQKKFALAPSSHAHLQHIKHKDCSDFKACLVKFKLSSFFFFLFLSKLFISKLNSTNIHDRIFLWTWGAGEMRQASSHWVCLIYSNVHFIYHGETELNRKAFRFLKRFFKTFFYSDAQAFN